jgi:hypothetical protein
MILNFEMNMARRLKPRIKATQLKWAEPQRQQGKSGKAKNFHGNFS